MPHHLTHGQIDGSSLDHNRIGAIIEDHAILWAALRQETFPGWTTCLFNISTWPVKGPGAGADGMYPGSYYCGGYVQKLSVVVGIVVSTVGSVALKLGFGILSNRSPCKAPPCLEDQNLGSY